MMDRSHNAFGIRKGCDERDLDGLDISRPGIEVMYIEYYRDARVAESSVRIIIPLRLCHL